MSEEGQGYGEPEFLGWYLLNRLKSQSDDQISRSKFLKLCCIADRRLLDAHDYEVGLPRYWYMYGELANEHEFSGRFYNAPQAIGWDGQQYLPKKLSFNDFSVTDEGLEYIDRAVQWVVQEFGRENVDSIKKHQYENHAENPFIREYSEVRWLLNEVDLSHQQRLANFGEIESNEEFLRTKLDSMMEHYPDDEPRYDEMKALYLRWDDTVRLMLDQSVEYSRIAEFLDDFILALSKTVLRFNYSHNISQARLSDWEEDAAKEKSEFATQVREVRKSLFSDRERSTELDRVSEGYSKNIEEKIETILAQR